ncbi:MAG TPA: SMC-Scp complex subunit ScpB [Gemmataceae bacterium]|jgi:segregation and condensation protein B|nr:SMC-Scp complex subunit ScpB [Gemmataceae bacterium]
MASVVPHDEPRAANNQANAIMIPARSSLLLPFPDSRRLPRNHPAPAGHALFLSEGNENVGRGEFARDAQMAALEAILFLADDPLTVKRLALVLRLADGTEARRQVRRLQALYEKENAAFEIVEVAGGFQLLTRPIFYRWLARMPKPPSELRLSGAALETLTIVGYRQPIMRADVEAIRGVQCGDILRQLMERGLVRIAGRHDSLGRPVLYGTTRKFLQLFGLKSLRDLPAIDAHRAGQAQKNDA